MDSLRLREYLRLNSLPVELAIAIALGGILGLSSILLSPLWTLVGVIGLIAVLLVIKRPELALLGFLFLTSTVISKESLPRLPFGIGRLMVTDIIIFGLFGYIVVQWLVDSKKKILLTPLGVPFLAFYLVGILSTVYQMYITRTLTLQESLGEIRIFNHYLAFLLVVNLIRDPKQLKLFLQGIFLLAVFAAVAMVIQFVLGPSNPILPGRVETLDVEGQIIGGVTRILIPGESLVIFAFMTSIVVIALDQLREGTWLYLLLSLLLGLGVVLTFNRGLWVGVAAGLFLLAWVIPAKLRSRLAGWAFIAVALFCLSLFVAFLTPKSRYARLYSGSLERLLSLTQTQTYQAKDSSLRWRDFEYQYAKIQLEKTPLWGIGLGAKYRPFVFRRDRVGFDGRAYTHNGFLYLVLKTGLVGLLCFFWLSGLFIWRGLKYWKKIPDVQMGYIVLGLTLAYIGGMIIAIVHPLYMQWNTTPVIGVVFGINEVIYRIYSPALPNSPS